MNLFTIKDLENLSGIKAHTLRIWEQRYNFIKPNRTKTNIRYYSSDELKTILNVSLLNKYGFKISHINRMSEKELKDKILSLNQAQAQQERLVNEMLQFMIDLDMEAFEKVLDKFVAMKGLEKSIIHLIFPFLEKIGILWLTNHINPAQEHLVSNIIRQKLIVGIESAESLIRADKKVLLFLPEGEYHELGLLFMHYIFKSRGISVVYLGSGVPLADIEYVVKAVKPDHLYTHLTSISKNFNFERFITDICRRLPGIPLTISGNLAASWEKKAPSSVSFKKNFSEVMEFVTAL